MHNSALTASTSSYFETTLNLKENNYNFGTIIFRKSCADRPGANRYEQVQKQRRSARAKGLSIHFDKKKHS
jgi:hypothetical protein